MLNKDAAQSDNDETGYFCWIRTVKVTTAAVRTAERVKLVPGILSRNDRRPPPTIRAKDSPPKDHMPAGWSASEELFGRDDAETVFEYGPAFYSRRQAEDWIAGAEGAVWDAAAENRMLISFSNAVADHIALFETACADVPKPPVKAFPDDCWEPELRHRWKGCALDVDSGQRGAEFKPEFLGETVPPLPSADEYWNQRPVVRYGPAVGNDPEQDPVVLHSEAHGAARVIAALFAKVGQNLDGPPVNLAMKRARTQLMDLVEPVVYALKVHHNRPRPWMVFPGLQPVFAGDDWRNPRHPAYPSGHAVTAGLWATLLGNKYPEKADELNLLAMAIAQRRVDAGLHFQADCDDGWRLGVWMAERVIEQAQTRTLPVQLRLFAEAYGTLP
jgi:membrane-associated phospholipid phosphatase